jgi:molecular chaperone DnaJ
MDGVHSGFDDDRARSARRAYEWQSTSGARAGGSSGFGGYQSFEDIFGDIFGGAAGAEPQQRPRRGADMESELEIGLLDAMRGTSTQVAVDRPEICDPCDGSGADLSASTPCSECDGSGSVRVAQGPVTFNRSCLKCGGLGRTGTTPCRACGGAGRVASRERLSVKIPPGVDNGSRVRVAGKGGAGVGGGTAGDLFIVIRVRPHGLIERSGDNLYMDLPITVGEAIRGGAVEVPTVDGMTVRVQIPEQSQSGKRLRVKGRGAPQLRGKDRGDLYLRLVVHVPHSDSPAALDASRVLDDAYGASPRAGLRL